jgi:glycosyltransferase involved in cell wall biosynthesis
VTEKLSIALCGPSSTYSYDALLAERVSSQGYPSGLIPNLAIELLRLGHRVTVVTTGQDVSEIHEYKRGDFELVIVPSWPFARRRALTLFSSEVEDISKVLQKRFFDIVHAHWTYEFALGAINAGNAPTLVTAHDSPFTILKHVFDPYRFLRLCLALKVRSKIRNLTTVSPYLADRWRKTMLYNRHIDVIANPIEHVSAKPEAILWRPGHGRLQILEVADSSPRKNVKRLISAFSRFKVEFQDCELSLVGSGLGADGAIAGWAHSAGLAEGVNFLGALQRDEVQRIMRQSHVFFHASLEESNPLVIIEALALGLPVCAGEDAGGTAWTMFEGAGGKLVDVKSVHEITEALKDFSSGQWGIENWNKTRNLVKERYLKDNVVRRYLEVYEKLINSRKP